MERTHITSVVPDLDMRSGGPTFAIVRLCEAGGVIGTEQLVVSGRSRGAALVPSGPLVSRKEHRIVRFPLIGLRWLPRARLILQREFERAGTDLVHSHGIWTGINHAATAAASRLRLPLIVSTHGMLATWAFSHKRWKKKAAWLLYQRRDLESAAVIRATAAREADDIRRLRLRRPIAVVPNPVDMPSLERIAAFPRTAASKGVRTVVFLGRIYPVKGLLNLVEAWARVRPGGWKCIIAGPNERGHQREVEAALSRAGINRDFEFPGPVRDSGKWDLLFGADLLVLPSFTENFGLVVPEALACGVPVITSRGTPWEDVVRYRCGWWVDNHAEALAAALREAIGVGDETRQEMGRRGQSFVRERFAPERVAREMNCVYEWALGRAPRPACVLEEIDEER